MMNEVGDVFPCEILTQSMGNVRGADYDFQKIFYSDDADRIRAGIHKTKCYCSHECYFVTNILFNPLMFGKVARQFLELPGREPAVRT